MPRWAIAEQQKGMEGIVAQLKEQAALIQQVGMRVQTNDPVLNVVVANKR